MPIPLCISFVGLRFPVPPFSNKLEKQDTVETGFPRYATKRKRHRFETGLSLLPALQCQIFHYRHRTHTLSLSPRHMCPLPSSLMSGCYTAGGYTGTYAIFNGVYTKGTQTRSGAPVYQQSSGNLYLFFDGSFWYLGTSIGSGTLTCWGVALRWTMYWWGVRGTPSAIRITRAEIHTAAAPANTLVRFRAQRQRGRHCERERVFPLTFRHKRCVHFSSVRDIQTPPPKKRKGKMERGSEGQLQKLFAPF